LQLSGLAQFRDQHGVTEEDHHSVLIAMGLTPADLQCTQEEDEADLCRICFEQPMNCGENTCINVYQRALSHSSVHPHTLTAIGHS
jgi:hypothetical protein